MICSGPMFFLGMISLHGGHFQGIYYPCKWPG
jgi:hypothetical protein